MFPRAPPVQQVCRGRQPVPAPLCAFITAERGRKHQRALLCYAGYKPLLSFFFSPPFPPSLFFWCISKHCNCGPLCLSFRELKLRECLKQLAPSSPNPQVNLRLRAAELCGSKGRESLHFWGSGGVCLAFIYAFTISGLGPRGCSHRSWSYWKQQVRNSLLLVPKHSFLHLTSGLQA